MKYSVITFGCRVNQADSLAFEEQLRAGGAVPAPSDEADLVVINSCSVTASADQGTRQTIRRVARANPSARIVVTGCYATRDPERVRELPNVEVVVPNDDKPRLVPLLIGPALTTAQRFGDGEGACGAAIEPGVAGRTAFTLRVQTGCSEPCSYCIIPATRGRPRSLTIAAILAEIDRVASSGFREIALTGVHLGSYGRDLAPATRLSALLRALIARRDPSLLFRISSLEPMDCTPEVVDLVASHACFAPHFHLPLQHASNRLLAAMRRPYTVEEYGALVQRIRRDIPAASIGTDLIAGFPGETDDDFETLRSFLAASPLTHAHVFPYSDRPGTAASSMSGKVAGDIVRARAQQLRETAARLSRDFQAGQIGTVHRALTLDDGTLVVTGNYLKLRIPAGRSRNEWLAVRVESTDRAAVL
jgi:threonylcarbamoyladenosine tRNA methylthiotransferase MtaB